MTALWYLLPALACPLGMATLMWLLIRPRSRVEAADDATERRELAALRSQIAAWRQVESDQSTATVGADR